MFFGRGHACFFGPNGKAEVSQAIFTRMHTIVNHICQKNPKHCPNVDEASEAITSNLGDEGEAAEANSTIGVIEFQYYRVEKTHNVEERFIDLVWRIRKMTKCDKALLLKKEEEGMFKVNIPSIKANIKFLTMTICCLQCDDQNDPVDGLPSNGTICELGCKIVDKPDTDFQGDDKDAVGSTGGRKQGEGGSKGGKGGGQVEVCSMVTVLIGLVLTYIYA